MSIGDRYRDLAPWITVAVGFLLIAGAGFSYFWSKGYQSANEQHETYRQSYHTAEEAYRECSTLPAVEEALRCYREAEKATREDHRAEQDLNAQREMADWAEGMIWLTGIIGALTIAVTTVGVYWVRETLTATREAVREAKRGADAAYDAVRITGDTAEKQLRAYIDVCDAEILKPSDPYGFKAQIRLQNFGQTPAYNVVVRRREKTVGIERLGSFGPSLESDTGTPPASIGNGSIFAVTIDNVLSPDELRNIISGDATIIIVGDVRYRDIYDKLRHQDFCLRVWHFRQPNERISPWAPDAT